jgi:hypothetical protein
MPSVTRPLSEKLRVTRVTFAPASAKEAETGLLGWISFVLNDSLRVDGLTVRRTRRRRLALSFPAKPGISGKQFFFVQPLNDEARREIECQIFEALGLKETATR